MFITYTDLENNSSLINTDHILTITRVAAFTAMYDRDKKFEDAYKVLFSNGSSILLTCDQYEQLKDKLTNDENS